MGIFIHMSYTSFILGPLILIANGQDENGQKSDFTQVIDTGNSENTCSNMSPYPIKMTATTGGVINGSPIICGGYNRFDQDDELVKHYNIGNHT